MNENRIVGVGLTGARQGVDHSPGLAAVHRLNNRATGDNDVR